MSVLFRDKRGWVRGLILFLFCLGARPATALGPHAPPDFERAVEHLCREVLHGHDPDPARIAPIIAHVRAHGDTSGALPRYSDAPGAYQGFAIDMPMQRLLRYLYNPEIPQELIKPFSIRSSVWTTQGSAEEQRRLWADPWPPAGTEVVRGEQYDRTTAELSTGGCYGMQLKRALVFLPDDKALLSVSVQPGPSEVGTRGYLVGRDQDSRYVYSDEEGLTKTGLGWVSSRIQTNVSIGVYLGEGRVVRSGVFQWMRAGWSGLSVVKESHIKASLVRYRERIGAILHAPGLPAPEDLEALFRALDAKSDEELRREAQPIVAEYIEAAERDRNRAALKILKNDYARRLDRAELIGLLMRDRLEDSVRPQ
ncbi:hypothetical protein H4684_001848 [Desulfomicrobium macestii]|uniref:HEAT repeat domain-containing protein n=1 Tax=Desulfomicrobium macestii TaxID=90731 RepID=A0ABR9H3B5_9BACT|nr:hypothetical protein [Desulfomicrobium macestii]MBE1425204.1 hypothetical protein [Desulfomicrobium macestii]